MNNEIELILEKEDKNLGLIFVLYQGDDLARNFILKSITGNPIDITNYYFIFTLKNLIYEDSTNDDDKTYQTNSSTGNISITYAVNGKFTLRIPRNETINFDKGLYSWDIGMKDSSNHYRTLIISQLDIRCKVRKTVET